MYISSWSSNLTLVDIKKNTGLLELIRRKDAYIDMAEVPESTVGRVNFSTHFDGAFKVTMTCMDFNYYGRQLIISVPAKTIELANTDAKNTSMQLISQVRVLFGLGAAVEKTLDNTFEIKTGTARTQFNSEVFSEIVGDGEENKFLSDIVESISPIKDLLLSPDESLMLDRAASSRTTWERFLFLWICLEFKIGGGEARISLYKKTLGSELINDEVYRLFLIRNKIAHEHSPPVSHNDCSSLLWALRIALLPTIKHQRAVVLDYEKWLVAIKS